LTAKTSKATVLVDSWIYTDANLKAFARGRRVWSRLTSLPYWQQEALREYYTPRQWPESPTHSMSKPLVRGVHRSYLGLGAVA
jgi:hypothetical protein